MSRFDGASLGDVVREGMEDRLRELNTCEPGEIVEYDAATQTVTVRPMNKIGVLDDEGAYVLEERPDIYDVPVMFPRTKAGYLSFPIVAGDTGLIAYAMRDIGQWRYTNQRVSPGDLRVCSMAGAIFIPGLYANANKLSNVSTQDVVLAPIGSRFLLLGAHDATEFVALAEKVLTELQAIRTWANSHTHSGVTTGTGATGAATPMSAPNSVAATKVKAK